VARATLPIAGDANVCTSHIIIIITFIIIII